MPKRRKHAPAPTDPSPVEGLDRSRTAGAPAGASNAQPSTAPETPDHAETSTAPTDSAVGSPGCGAQSAAAPEGAQPFDRCPSSASLEPPQAALGSVPAATAAAVEPAAPPPAPPSIPLPRTILDGVVRKNPVLVAGLGLAPALLLSDAAAALAIGVCTTLALLVTSLLASLLGRYLPEKFRPALFTLAAAGVTVALEFGTGALFPDLLPRTALYIALIAVGGITLARAEYSTARSPLAALVDALANGVGCTLALTLIGALRELFGAGSIFGVDVTFGVFPPMSALTTAAGGFILVGLLAGAMQGIRLYRARLRAARSAAKTNDKEVSA